MALKRHLPSISDEDAAIWPTPLPDPTGMTVLYGADADELVVRFVPGRRDRLVVVDPVADPHDYASLMIDSETRAVVGVHVYPLLAFAVERHPGWAALAEKEPPSAAVASIVADIKGLFELHGFAPLIDA
jgi:hypothetical protein